MGIQTKQVQTGFAIVVADRGWVYVGDVAIDDAWCVITNARSIRRWGTTHGLGQLALSGPTTDTRADKYGTVRAPMHAVISLIDAEPGVWTR